MTLVALAILVTSAFCQAVPEMYNGKGNNIPIWLTISIIVVVILAMVFLIKKVQNNNKLIVKLTPVHFANGESFDEAVFASLIAIIHKSASDAWKMPVIILVMFGLGFLCVHGIGGFIGNILAVFCFILAVPVGNLSIIKTSKQIKSIYKTLGITQKDVNAAIRQLKQKTLSLKT